MKTLLILLAILLIAAGVAVGLMNVYSPGTVTVGLNLDVAATLFTGGCVLLGLGVVAGNLAALTRRDPDEGVVDDYQSATQAGTDLPDFMAPAAGAAAGAGAAAAAGALDDTRDGSTETAPGTGDDVLDGITKDGSPTTESTAGSIFGTVTDKAAEAGDEVADKAEEVAEKVEEAADDAVEKARDDLSSFFAKPADTSSAPQGDATLQASDDEAETADDSDSKQDTDASDKPDIFSGAGPIKASDARQDAPEPDAGETGATAEDAADSAAEQSTESDGEASPGTDSAPEALPQEEELFVVEERVIRNRPARLLSDGTVEAETDEGWMRFENVEHVEEYLDAMRATA